MKTTFNIKEFQKMQIRYQITKEMLEYENMMKWGKYDAEKTLMDLGVMQWQN